jgi:hypothetical protein
MVAFGSPRGVHAFTPESISDPNVKRSYQGAVEGVLGLRACAIASPLAINRMAKIAAANFSDPFFNKLTFDTSGISPQSEHIIGCFGYFTIKPTAFLLLPDFADI